MKRKDYRKPTMMVVKVQQLLPLMDSGTKGVRNSYGKANENVSSDEKKNGIWEWN